eukprot:gene19637-biopygen16068
MGSGPYNSPWGARGHVGRGRCAVPRTPTSPLYRSGPYSWGPNPRHIEGLFVASPPGVGSRSAVPRTPTRPRYRHHGGSPIPPTDPSYRLRARSTGSGTHSWGPNPRHIPG